MDTPDFSKPYIMGEGWTPPAPSLIQIINEVQKFTVSRGEKPAAIIMGLPMYETCQEDADLAHGYISALPPMLIGVPILVRHDVTPTGVFLVKQADIGDLIHSIVSKDQADLTVEQDDAVKALINKYTMEAAKPFRG